MDIGQSTIITSRKEEKRMTLGGKIKNWVTSPLAVLGDFLAVGVGATAATALYGGFNGAVDGVCDTYDKHTQIHEYRTGLFKKEKMTAAQWEARQKGGK